MLELIIICIVIIVVFLFLSKKEKWLRYGQKHRQKKLIIRGNKYIEETAEFDTGKDSAHNIYLIVNDLLKREGLLETKYDWYDWSANILRYKDVSVRLFRFGRQIKLIRSTFPISIQEMEEETSNIV